MDCKEYSHEVNIKSQDELQNLGNCDSIQTIDIAKNSEKKKENVSQKNFKVKFHIRFLMKN